MLENSEVGKVEPFTRTVGRPRGTPIWYYRRVTLQDHAKQHDHQVH